MSFAMTNAQVRDHMRDLQRQASRCRTGSPRSAQVHGGAGRPDPRHPAGRPHRLPRLRSQVGFRLIEAGLHLLADSR
jgi:hypothetical protein